MTLSELVHLKTLVNKWSNVDGLREAQQKISTAIGATMSLDADLEVAVKIANISSVCAQGVTKTIADVGTEVKSFNDYIDVLINEAAAPFLLKDINAVNNTIENDRTIRQLPKIAAIEEQILTRIRRHSDWHYPCLQICPRDGEYTDHLVGFDPLYLVELHQEYLDVTKSKYPVEYQARVRDYLIGNGRYEWGMTNLPLNQFGFIFCWNHFNYQPIQEIQKYLKDIVQLLRPGGSCMFSFNDCDTFHGAKHVEFGGVFYTTKKMIVKLVTDLGLEVTDAFSFETTWHNISWLEVKKPGTLDTIKAHQTLGLVKDIK
jgi:SAM-dependent methyltransferase